MNRPVVVVYEEFATLSTPTQDPELTPCIIGPCYQIVDYPEDRPVDVNGALVPDGHYGTSGSPAPAAPVVVNYSALLAGATVDLTSVKAHAENVKVLVKSYSALTTVAAGLTITVADPVGDGIQVGDSCVLTDANTKKLVRTVRAVDSTAHTVTFADPFPADNAAVWTNGSTVTAQFERSVGSADVSAALTPGATSVSIATGFAVGGKNVVAADIYVSYRALRSDLSTFNTLTNFTVDSSGNLGSVGKIDARNPLAAALYVCAQNTNTPIFYFGIPTNDTAGYLVAKSALSNRKDIYAVGLCTNDPSVAQSFGQDFQNSADPSYALTNGVAQRFRMAFGSAGDLPLVKTLVAKNTRTVTAVTTAFTDVSGGFVDAGVIVGDLVRFYQADGSTTTRAVTAVVSNQALTVVSVAGVTATNLGYDVVRDISTNKDAQVSVLVSRAQPANRRVVLIWPDKLMVTGLVDGSKARLASGAKAPADAQSGFYAACGLVGLVASSPSHQGFTNAVINGIGALSNSGGYFTDKQITALSNTGLCVLTQDDVSTPAYIVHELTTDPSALEFGEIMCVKNMDFVAMSFRDVLSGFIGTWNLTKEAIGFMSSALNGKLAALMSDKRAKLGARVKSGSITSIGESAISADRAECYLTVQLPKPLNTIGLHVVSN